MHGLGSLLPHSLSEPRHLFAWWPQANEAGEFGRRDRAATGPLDVTVQNRKECGHALGLQQARDSVACLAA